MKESIVIGDMYSGELLRVDYGFEDVEDNIMYQVERDDNGEVKLVKIV
jgi:hypothetical protein